MKNISEKANRASMPFEHKQRDRVAPDAIQTLLAELADDNGLRRRDARLRLAEIGKPVVPALVRLLTDHREQVRWEAAKALSQIGDPAAAPALIQVLEDENFGVRWLAAEGLIAAGKGGLVPLLQALEKHSDSGWLREGAHHVIRTLVSKDDLHDILAPVLAALDDVEPMIETPLAAQKALEGLVRRSDEHNVFDVGL